MSIGELRQKLVGLTIVSVTETVPGPGCAGYTVTFNDKSVLHTEWCGGTGAVKFTDPAGNATAIEPEKTEGPPLRMDLVP